MQFRKNFNGRLWGAVQVVFWVILMPIFILTMPLDLYYENSPETAPFAVLYTYSFIDWRVWALICIGTIFLIFSIGTIRLGWRRMHPEGQVPKVIREHRKKFARGFSKAEFLEMLKKGTI